jgi:cell division protease FtsH
MPPTGLTPISQLPSELTHQQAVEVTYQADLDWVEEKLDRRISTLIECDKQLVLYLYRALRRRMKARGSQLNLKLIGGPDPESGGNIVGHTVKQMTEAIFSGESDMCLVIPHLDVVVTTTKSGLSDRAREVVAMIYENPELCFVAFKDPSFDLPKAVSDVFTAKRQIAGVSRDRLPHVILQREARKFGVSELNPFRLYKYVSGLNAVRLRQVLEPLSDRLDFNPSDPAQTERLYRELREMTLVADMDLPNVDLDRDIGGYADVKDRIRREILNLLLHKEQLTDPDAVKEIEEIIPKGMLFVGPPGTGKTFFAKAMATALDATVLVVSGPELKSKWVGESEGNLRQIFARARKSAPSIIIFDEIDSFATVRGTYGGSGVEHSMVNQLLTEMDGFRKEELIFVVGTTNFPESLDPALLRPGRFELHIEIPYPTDEDRKIILGIYRKKFRLNLSDELLQFLVQKTAGFADEANGVRFSGDHLYAVARSLKREEIRRIEGLRVANEPVPEGGVALTRDDCLQALSKKSKANVEFKAAEERTIAIHEAGHAIMAHFCPSASAIERVTIATGDEDTLGYVMRSVREHRYVVTRAELLDDVCVLLGGRVAEELCLGDISMGCHNDLQKATEIARVMVEELGMADEAGVRSYTPPPGVVHVKGQRPTLSEATAQQLDAAMRRLLDEQLARAREMFTAHRVAFDQLVDVLLEKKTLYLKDINAILGARPARAASPAALAASST